MRQFIAIGLFGLLAQPAEALVISSAGHYIVDSHIDEVIVDSSVENAGEVFIDIVSGGFVDNNVLCARGENYCNFNVTVSGNGTVMGRVRGAGAIIDIRDDARVTHAGVQRDGVGRLLVSGNAYVGTLTGAGSGSVGKWEISGGYIEDAVVFPNSLSMSMSGGVLNDNLFAWGLGLELTGGDILGTVVGDSLGLSLSMRGGHISGDVVASSAVLSGYIAGGAIDGDLRSSIGGNLDIYGGQFGPGNGDSLWRLSGSQVFNVHGRGLVLDNGFLTGYLLDGSYLNVGISYADFFRGALNIHNVPEPGTLSLLGVGILGMFVARRRGGSKPTTNNSANA